MKFVFFVTEKEIQISITEIRISFFGYRILQLVLVR